MKKKPGVIKAGRPRTFDPEVALDAAMRAFWKHGYSGTSLDDLTAAMGINRPSMYAAFGNKQSLFLKAVDRYVSKLEDFVQEAMAMPTARQTAEHLLKLGLRNSTSGKVKGCLLVQGALACGDADETVKRELTRRRGHLELLLRARFEKSKSDGDLPATCDAGSLAKFVATFQHGIAVQLASGADTDALLATIDIAMRSFPLAAG